MPGAEQSEHFAAKAAGEKPVHFVQSPHQRARDFAQNFLLDKHFEIKIGTDLRTPVLQCSRIQLKVGVEGGSESFEKRLSRLQIGGVEHLEVSHDNFPALLARLLKAARQQRGFPHLARPFDQHDAVLTGNGGAKLFVHRALDVVF